MEIFELRPGASKEGTSMRVHDDVLRRVQLARVSEFTIHQVGDVRLQGVRGDVLFVTDAHRSEGGPR